MSTPPRRRRPAAPNSKGEGGGWLPTIAMGIGVVVAGLGIGALIAVLMQRSNLKAPVASAPVVVVTSTPATDLPTRGPIAIATLASPRTPRPSPPPSAAPTRTQPMSSPSAAPSPTPAPPTAMPPSATTSTATATAPTPFPPTPKPSARIAAIAPALTARPSTPGATPLPQATQATPTPAATTASVASAGTPTVASAGAPSSYDEHASSVVRRYLDALIRGDEKSAYTALGGAGGTLSEQAFLDPGSRIVSIKVTRIDASNASVGCEITASKGHYYATFHVTAASSGPYIAQHDFIKV